MVLLVVDTQKAITNEKLYNFQGFVTTVRTIIETARENEIEVIYVRHDDGSDSDLTKGKAGYEIYEAFKPAEGERIFDKKVNSAFKESGLWGYLTGKEEKEVVIVGLQTEYCMDATIKAGFEHDFHMIVPVDANTTIDNPFMHGEQTHAYYNEFIWKGRYAECLSLEGAIERMKLR